MIFCVSSIPKLETPAALPFLDKIIHIIEYGIFGFLFVRALANLEGADGNVNNITILIALFFVCYTDLAMNFINHL